MIPQPDEPKAVVLLNQDGKVLLVASNIHNLKINTVRKPSEFDEAALGLPFNPVKE